MSIDVFIIWGFALLLWTIGEVLDKIYIGLLGEICSASILGPPLFNLLPTSTYSISSILGNIGVTLLVFQSALTFKLFSRNLVIISIAIALVGCLLPILSSLTLFTFTFRYDTLTGLVAGACLSSTSIAIVVRMLLLHDRLETDIGRVLSLAAIVDDIVSLVMLSVLTGMQSSQVPDVWSLIQPMIASLLLFIAMFPLKHILDHVFIQFESYRIHLLVLSCFSVSFISHIIGSSNLLGAFMVGVACASNENASLFTSPLITWLVRFFFASVGFDIPLLNMFSASVVWKGIVTSIVAGILAKVFTLFIARFCLSWEKSVAVGVAMIGRGELGYIMAQISFKSGLMDEEAFGVVVWAITVATVVSPGMFYFSLRFIEKEENGVISQERVLIKGYALKL